MNFTLVYSLSPQDLPSLWYKEKQATMAETQSRSGDGSGHFEDVEEQQKTVETRVMAPSSSVMSRLESSIESLVNYLLPHGQHSPRMEHNRFPLQFHSTDKMAKCDRSLVQ